MEAAVIVTLEGTAENLRRHHKRDRTGSRCQT
jgi:hypothetical protein